MSASDDEASSAEGEAPSIARGDGEARSVARQESGHCCAGEVKAEAASVKITAAIVSASGVGEGEEKVPRIRSSRIVGGARARARGRGGLHAVESKLHVSPSLPLNQNMLGSPAAADPFDAVVEAVHEARKANESLQAERDRLLGELETFKDQSRRAAAELSDLRDFRREQLVLQEHQQAQSENVRDEVATLRARLSRAEVSAEERAEEVSSALKRVRSAEAEADELRSRLNQREETLARAIDQLQERHTAILAAEKTERELRESLDAARADSERRAAANEGLRGKLLERESRLAEILQRTQRGTPLCDLSNAEQAQARLGGGGGGGGGGGIAPTGGAAHVASFAKDVISATRCDRSGQNLEELSRRLFIAEGYEVPPRRSGSCDGGIDIWMHDADDVTHAVQCKSKAHSATPVGEVRAFVGAMEERGVGIGFFVTNQSFTSDALEYARSVTAATAKTLHLYAAPELTVMLSRHADTLRADPFIVALLEAPAHGPSTHDAATRLQRAARRRSSLGGRRAGGALSPTSAMTTPPVPRSRPSPSTASNSDTSPIEPTPPSMAPAHYVTRRSPPGGVGSRTPRRERVPFTGEEDALLIRLFHELRFHEYEGARRPWKYLLDTARSTHPGVFHVSRDPVSLKDKARNLCLIEKSSRLHVLN